MTKTRAKDELLGQLHEALALHLLTIINSGEASAQEMNAAIKFLADNHIEVDTTPESPAQRLADALPTFTDDDTQVTAH